MKEYAQILLQHHEYQRQLQQLEALEENRLYCKHNLEHFLEVARIGCVIARENQLSYDEDIITMAALLHDMGRVQQYQKNVSHQEASVAFGREILLSIGLEQEIVEEIVAAIGKHSNRGEAEQRYLQRGAIQTLEELLSFADQFSRKCYTCQAINTCKWPKEEKIGKEYFKNERNAHWK